MTPSPKPEGPKQPGLAPASHPRPGQRGQSVTPEDGLTQPQEMSSGQTCLPAPPGRPSEECCPRPVHQQESWALKEEKARGSISPNMASVQAPHCPPGRVASSAPRKLDADGASGCKLIRAAQRGCGPSEVPKHTPQPSPH